jgi:2-methylisocitrate lyase-like PEP mutase family enzyme
VSAAAADGARASTATTATESRTSLIGAPFPPKLSVKAWGDVCNTHLERVKEPTPLSSVAMTTHVAERRRRFGELHAREQLFVMPNPWDVGSARLLEHSGFEALATTSAGYAWSLGKLDQRVTRGELVAHVAELTAAVSVPLNVDSERCYPDDPGGIAETVALLAEAGAAGFSIEDYNPAVGRIDDLDVAVEQVAIAVDATHALGEPMVLTARAENHIRGVDDFDDTIVRLTAYRDAGADVVYAPGLTELGQISAVVSLGVPVNVLARPTAPSLSELESAGVRRVSTGSLLTAAAYGALVDAAQELRTDGTSTYAANDVARETFQQAFG